MSTVWRKPYNFPMPQPFEAGGTSYLAPNGTAVTDGPPGDTSVGNASHGGAIPYRVQVADFPAQMIMASSPIDAWLIYRQRFGMITSDRIIEISGP